MLSYHLLLCHPLLLPPSIFPSIRVFSNESVLHIRWPKYWGFSFSSSPSNEYSGLISFRMDWLDLLAVQGTLKSLLQHHSSKAPILQHSAFFTVQLSHPYMTTGKTIALTRRAFVGKIMSLLFNMLCRLVIAFLPRSKPLLISWLQSPCAVILEGFPHSSDGKVSARNVTNLGLIPELGRYPGEGHGYPLQYSGLGPDCSSDRELLISNIRLKWKKVGKTTRSFRCDLNQISYDYTVEVTNRFKGLDVIEFLKNFMDRGWWHCTGGSDQDCPKEKEMKKVVWRGLSNSWGKKRS